MKLLQLITIPFAFAVLAACTDTGNFPTTSSKEPAGNPNSPIVLAEYADLQCPACKAAHEQVIKPILEEYGNEIRYEFNHFPLRQIHRYALPAAKAAECAADQGKFWEFVDIAYENQEDMNNDVFESWGQMIGIQNTSEFVDCAESDAKRDLILAEYDEGRDLGVGGTPTLFLNGTQVSTSLAELRSAIEAEITRVESQL